AFSYVAGSGAGLAATLAEGTRGVWQALRLGVGDSLVLTLAVVSAGLAALLGRAPEAAPPAARPDDPLPAGAVARLGSDRWHAADWNVSAIAYAPDGKNLAALGVHGLSLLDAGGRRVARTLHDGGETRGLAVSPDGRRVAAVLHTNAVVWEVPSGRELRRLAVPGLKRVGWSSGGDLVGVVAVKGAILFRDLDAGTERRLAADDLQDPRFDLFACAHCPAAALLAVGGEGPLVHVWDVTTGKERLTLDTKAGAGAHRLWLSPDGRWLAVRTGGDDEARGVQLWDLTRGTLARRVATDQIAVYVAAFSPDGRTLAAVGGDSVRLWDVTTGRPRATLTDAPRSTEAVAFAPDGNTLAMIPRMGGRVGHWDLATGTRVPSPPCHDGQPHQIDFSPDGTRLVSSDISSGTFLVWDLANANLVTRIGGGNLARGAYFSADGRGLFTAWAGPGVSFRDASTGRVLHAAMLSDPERPGHRQSVLSLHVAGDRKSLVAVSIGYPSGSAGHAEDRMLLTGLEAATRATTFRRHRPYTPSWPAIAQDLGVAAVVVVPGDPRGERVMEDTPIRLEEPRTGRHLRTLLPGRASRLGFSADGRKLVTASPRLPRSGPLRLWERVSGGEAATLPAEAGHPWAFSPDGRMLAASVGGNVILLWDLRRGVEAGRLRGASTGVSVLGFSPDGRRLASGHEDGTLLIWDVPADGKTARLPLDAEKAWADLL
ncbi:MAG: WD40 repeat domain-containing protein, partial [Gemmataceae bacterium]